MRRSLLETRWATYQEADGRSAKAQCSADSTVQKAPLVAALVDKWNRWKDQSRTEDGMLPQDTGEYDYQNVRNFDLPWL
jgi:hypothetical protein